MKAGLLDSASELTEEKAKPVLKPRVLYGGGKMVEVGVDADFEIVISPHHNSVEEMVQRFGRANRYASTRESQKGQRPPQLATFLLRLFLSVTDRDNMIGDLDERFPKWVERHGVIIAHMFYVKDAWTMAFSAVHKLLATIAEITSINEIIRRIRFW
jgi:hypothetical protein